MSGKTGIINDLRMLQHKSKRKHPQNPARVKAIMKMLKEKHYLEHPGVDFIEQYDREANDQELGLAYSNKYIEYVRKLWPSSSHRIDLTVLDTYFNERSNEIARLSAGGVLEGLDHVMSGRWTNGFSIIRPPGHHSGGRNTINGFCIFNNVAIGAKYLQDKYGIKKIAILDYDIHHGDGTQHIFNDDPNVLFISIHRYDHGSYYPAGEGANYLNCGQGAAEGTKVNIPLNYVDKKRKTYPFQAPGDNEYVYIYNRIIDPILREFEPEFIIVSSGFDASRYDYLGGFTVTPNSYFFMTKRLLELGKPMLCVLEGGYNYHSTALASLAVVKGLLNEDKLPQKVEGITYENIVDHCQIQSSYHEHIDQVIAHHSKHWKSLNSKELERYTIKIKSNSEKMFGVVGEQETSSSSSEEQKEEQTKPEKKKIENSVIEASEPANNQESTTQFYFAAGHMQRFKHFSINNDKVHKWAYPEEIAFYSNNFPETKFSPKFYGIDGEYVVIENCLFKQKDFVVMDIKLARVSKNTNHSADKIAKEKEKEIASTSDKYAFRIGGYTTPNYKEGALLISDENVVRKLLLKVVDATNKNLFCEFLTEMSQTMKEVKRKYYGTSIILIKGPEKSNIKWVDFHYWYDNCESYDADLVEGLDNLCKFISEVETV